VCTINSIKSFSLHRSTSPSLRVLYSQPTWPDCGLADASARRVVARPHDALSSLSLNGILSALLLEPTGGLMSELIGVSTSIPVDGEAEKSPQHA